MREGEDDGGWRTSLASKIIGDDEDELESDDLYSDEDLTLNSLGNLRCIQPWGNVWKNNMGIMRITGYAISLAKCSSQVAQ